MPTGVQVGTFRGANVPTEGKNGRLGTKRCSGVPTGVQAGTFRGANVSTEENTDRLGTKKATITVAFFYFNGESGSLFMYWYSNLSTSLGKNLFNHTVSFPIGVRTIWAFLL